MKCMANSLVAFGGLIHIYKSTVKHQGGVTFYIIISNTKAGPTILYVSKNINILESNFYSSDTCESGTCKCGTSAECKGSLCISGVCEGRSFLNWCRNY